MKISGKSIAQLIFYSRAELDKLFVSFRFVRRESATRRRYGPRDARDVVDGFLFHDFVIVVHVVLCRVRMRYEDDAWETCFGRTGCCGATALCRSSSSCDGAKTASDGDVGEFFVFVGESG